MDSHVRCHGRHPHNDGENFEELQTFLFLSDGALFSSGARQTRCHRNTNMSSTCRREPSPCKVPYFFLNQDDAEKMNDLGRSLASGS